MGVFDKPYAYIIFFEGESKELGIRIKSKCYYYFFLYIEVPDDIVTTLYNLICLSNVFYKCFFYNMVSYLIPSEIVYVTHVTK